jgi:hypothetical protein
MHCKIKQHNLQFLNKETERMKRKSIKIGFIIGLLSIALALFWIGCGNDTPDNPEVSYSSAPPNDVIEKVKAVQEKHTEELMAIPDVVGTAVGLAEDNTLEVVVLTKKSDVKGIPASLDGVRIKVAVTGEIKALKNPTNPVAPIDLTDPTKRFPRPVPIGVSTGHPAITAGTISCRVKKGENVYALSNNHVYANENKAALGDNVLQPGRYDGGVNPTDKIGTLSAFVPIVFTKKANNVIDAAIALSSTGDLGNSTPSNGYGTPKSTIALASIKMPVMKYGRTTRLTKGSIYAVNATVNVGYSKGTARFIKQIIITPGTFSAGGDSGSLIVEESTLKPVGLLFAGSSTMTIANPIDAVLTSFGVTVDGQ